MSASKGLAKALPSAKALTARKVTSCAIAGAMARAAASMASRPTRRFISFPPAASLRRRLFRRQAPRGARLRGVADRLGEGGAVGIGERRLACPADQRRGVLSHPQRRLDEGGENGGEIRVAAAMRVAIALEQAGAQHDLAGEAGGDRLGATD